jgi:hypothetical protein
MITQDTIPASWFALLRRARKVYGEDWDGDWEDVEDEFEDWLDRAG